MRRLIGGEPETVKEEPTYIDTEGPKGGEVRAPRTSNAFKLFWVRICKQPATRSLWPGLASQRTTVQAAQTALRLQHRFRITCAVFYAARARQVVELDKVLQVVMEVLTMQQSAITARLKRLFVEGDDNGDGVLSFEEFNAIVTNVAPDFSERRILRMFREALTSGAESSFAIEKETFIQVCKAHGLVQLIDIRALEQQELLVQQWQFATGRKQ
ncbi:hypothetical protein JKP88DRAFT_253882 [Tribonema minus]|uniref:EF-hand domain-containing protein n=1 Tax=Tribonema minus TaxID=303371 RepID=A0A835Z527_9STRA|nr:hypothetical protein JKP88DRAFT_253882 [Tribonema minus]